MGIEYRAAIVVGLPKNEFGDFTDTIDWQEDLDDIGLQHFPPYFDASLTSGVIGVEVLHSPDYYAQEIDPGKFGVDLRDAQHKFHAITGLAGKLYLTPVGW